MDSRFDQILTVTSDPIGTGSLESAVVTYDFPGDSGTIRREVSANHSSRRSHVTSQKNWPKYGSPIHGK